MSNMSRTSYGNSELMSVLEHDQEFCVNAILDVIFVRNTEMKGGGRIMDYESGSCSVVCAPVEARKFFTREEKIAMLSDYKKTLEREAQGVAERIQELEKQKE